MAASLDKNYRLIQIAPTPITKNDFVEVYSYIGRGWIDCVVLSISDTDMSIEVEVDGVKVIDGFVLKDFSSIYGIVNHNNLPLTSVDSKTFKYQPRDWQQFDASIKIKLKHNSKSDKNLEGGYITFQGRS